MLKLIVSTGLFLSIIFLPSLMNTSKDPLGEMNSKINYFVLYLDKSKDKQDNIRIGDICLIGNGEDYAGKVSQTKSGITCQKWNVNSPHSSYFVDLGDHNYCRNPDGASGVWCYTASANKRWELCDVPACVNCDGKSRNFRRCGQCGNRPLHCGGPNADCQVKDDFCVNIRGKFKLMDDGNLCEDPWIPINTEEECIAAAKFLNLEYRNSFVGPGAFPDCLLANDGRGYVYYNRSPKASDVADNKQYAGVCKAPTTVPASTAVSELTIVSAPSSVSAPTTVPAPTTVSLPTTVLPSLSKKDTSNKQGDILDEPGISSNKNKVTPNKQGYMSDKPQNSPSKLEGTPDEEVGILDETGDYSSKKIRSTSISHKSGGVPYIINISDNKISTTSDETLATQHKSRSRQGIPGDKIDRHGKELNKSEDITTIPMDIQGEPSIISNISGDIPDKLKNEKEQFLNIYVDLPGGAPIQHKTIATQYESDAGLDQHRGMQNYPDYLPNKHDESDIGLRLDQHKGTQYYTQKYLDYRPDKPAYNRDESDDGLNQHRGTKNYTDYIPNKHDESDEGLRLDQHRGTQYYTQKYPDYIPDKLAYNRDESDDRLDQHRGTQNYPYYIPNNHDESDDGLRLDQHRGTQYYTQNYPDYIPDKLAYNPDESGRTSNQHGSSIYYTHNAPDYSRVNLRNILNEHGVMLDKYQSSPDYTPDDKSDKPGNRPYKSEERPDIHGDTTDKHKNTTNKYKDNPDEYKDMSDKHGDTPDMHKDIPEKHKNKPDKNGNKPNKNKDIPVKNGDIPDKHKDILDENSHTSDTNEAIPDKHKDKPDKPDKNRNTPDKPDKNGDTPDKKEYIPDKHKDKPDKNRDTPDKHKEIPDKHKDTPNKKEDTPHEPKDKADKDIGKSDKAQVISSDK